MVSRLVCVCYNCDVCQRLLNLRFLAVFPTAVSFFQPFRWPNVSRLPIWSTRRYRVKVVGWKKSKCQGIRLSLNTIFDSDDAVPRQPIASKPAIFAAGWRRLHLREASNSRTLFIDKPSSATNELYTIFGTALFQTTTFKEYCKCVGISALTKSFWVR